MPFRTRLAWYLKHRLMYVAFLWAGVAFAVVAGPHLIAMLQRNDARTDPLVDLTTFADWRLPVALLLGLASVQVIFFALARITQFRSGDRFRARVATSRCLDELSAALTHVSCASILACFVSQAIGPNLVISVLLGLGIAALTYEPPGVP